MIFIPSIRACSGKGMGVGVKVGAAVDVAMGVGSTVDPISFTVATLNRATGAVGVVPGVGVAAVRVGIVI
jgi:hypothetical protein